MCTTVAHGKRVGTYMCWTAPGVPEARVRRLGSDDLNWFVTELWTARGFEPTRNGASVVARRAGKTQRDRTR